MSLSSLLSCAAETGEPLGPEVWERIDAELERVNRVTAEAKRLCADARQTCGGKLYLPGDPADLINAIQQLDKGA